MSYVIYPKVTKEFLNTYSPFFKSVAFEIGGVELYQLEFKGVFEKSHYRHFQNEKDAMDFIEAFKELLKSYKIPEQHTWEIFYFATLIEDEHNKIRARSKYNTDEKERGNLLTDLLAFPKKFNSYKGKIELEIPSDTEFVADIYTISKENIDELDGSTQKTLRRWASIRNIYNKVNTDEEIEVSKDITITISSNLDKKLSIDITQRDLIEAMIITLTDSLIKTQAIGDTDLYRRLIASNTISNGETLLANKRAAKKETLKIPKLISNISLTMLDYLKTVKELKLPSSGIVSDQQANFLFDFFALIGLVFRKSEISKEIDQKENLSDNKYIQKYKELSKSYRFPTDKRAQYIRTTILDNRL